MSKKLLIADDAAIIREMIKEAAINAGWEVVAQANNGQMAIDMFQEFRPDVCTLDLVMPEFDGMHALRGIKAIDPDAKVVVVSALEQKSVLKDTFSLGASDFIVKPFQQSALINTLEQLVMEAG
jgi:two-component system, chemotaxis family, chemotaxis protein CheY